MKRKQEDSLEERVAELEAEVNFLKWLIDKHIYEDYPVRYYFTDIVPKPDPLTGWRIT